MDPTQQTTKLYTAAVFLKYMKAHCDDKDYTRLQKALLTRHLFAFQIMNAIFPLLSSVGFKLISHFRQFLPADGSEQLKPQFTDLWESALRKISNKPTKSAAKTLQAPAPADVVDPPRPGSSYSKSAAKTLQAPAPAPADVVDPPRPYSKRPEGDLDVTPPETSLVSESLAPDTSSKKRRLDDGGSLGV
jgi:hypothetical protein